MDCDPILMGSSGLVLDLPGPRTEAEAGAPLKPLGFGFGVSPAWGSLGGIRLQSPPPGVVS